MKRLSRIYALGIVACVLAACSSGPSSTPTTLPVAKAANVSRYNESSSILYVLNSGSAEGYNVTVYPSGARSPLRTIPIGKYSEGFTADSSGKLYVGLPANEGDPDGAAILNIYENRGAKLLRTLHQNHPFGLLTTDESGNLVTLCAADRLCEYADARQHVIRRIALRPLGSGASALAVDPSGNLAVDNIYGSVFVFAPGATQPYWVTQYANDYSTAASFDAGGNLYVANFGSSDGDPGSVQVFSPGSKTPKLTITNGIAKPNALAFDASGNLYVLNYCTTKVGICQEPPSVTVYSPGGGTPVLTITNGIEGVGGLAFDLAGNLYVANEGNARFSPPDPGSVSVYPAGASSPSQVITTGIQNPTAIEVFH